MKTGTLKQVSPYGFRITDNAQWFNFNKSTNQVMVEFAKANKGKVIEWDENKNGLVIRLALHNEVSHTPKLPVETKPSKSLMMKYFHERRLADLETKINTFGASSEIKATQTHVTKEGYLAFVWYK